MDRKEFVRTMAAALAAVLLSGIEAPAQSPSPAPNRNGCRGKNACKGQGGCKTGDRGCRGKNTCRGKGGCSNKSGCKAKKSVSDCGPSGNGCHVPSNVARPSGTPKPGSQKSPMPRTPAPGQK